MKSYISIKKAIQQKLWTRKENRNTRHIEIYITLYDKQVVRLGIEF